jgi:hypothetical protein
LESTFENKRTGGRPVLKETWMRIRILVAIIVTAIVVLPLTGCGKKENQAPAKDKTAAPTSKTTKTPAKAPAHVSAPAAKSEAAIPAAKSESTASAPVVTQAPAKPTYLGEIIAAWNMGKRGEAVNQFLQLDWKDPSVFQGVPGLAMSEQMFASLPAAQRDQMNQVVQQLCQTFRDLAKAVVSSSESFIASNNTEGAKARLEAVQQFGQALAAPDRLQIFQLVGQAVTKLAQEKLSGIK